MYVCEIVANHLNKKIKRKNLKSFEAAKFY
jgi:hypothetical protein